MGKKISFIIPIYNTEKYINNCIESIVNQGLENYEIILIDDGSTDNSSQICDTLSESNNNIIVYHRKNSGVSASRNFGIKKSTGDKIFFVDSDDTLEPNSLKNIKSIDYDFICFGYKKIFRNTTIPCVDMKIKVADKNEIINYIHCNQNVAGYLFNKIFDRNIIINNNIFFDENIKYCEDLLFVDNYIQCAKSFMYYPLVIYNYLQRKNSASFSKYTTNNLTIFNAYEKIINRYIDNHELIIRYKFDYIIKANKMKKIITKEIYENMNLYLHKDNVLKYISLHDRIYYIAVKYFLLVYNSLRKIKHSIYKLYD